MESSTKLLCLLLIQIVLLDVSGAKQTCYDCLRVPFPSDCDHVMTCSENSNCYVEEVITDSGHNIYNVGCRSKARCQAGRRRNSLSFGRAPAADVMDDITGDIVVCEKCCQDDYCNSQGCNSNPLPPLSNRGPVCYSCHQQASHDTCDILKVCDHDEICFMSPQVSPTGNNFFTTGCRKRFFCQSLTQVAVGRRSVPDCTGCCSQDYCNRDCSFLHQHGYTHSTPLTSQTPSVVPTVTVTDKTSTVPSTTLASTTSVAVINKKLCTLLGYTYTEAFNTCYKLYNNVIHTWQQSRDQCKRDGGDLIVFNSLAEETYFAQQAIKFNHLDLPRFWVGATNQNPQQTWRWLDDRPVDKPYFHPNEPNNRNGEHCAALAMFKVHGNISMNDDTCDVQTNFMCEFTLQSLQTTESHGSTSFCRNQDYTYIPSIGMCYKIYKNVMRSQSAARSVCRSESADLLILRNATVEHFFQTLPFYAQDESIRYWLGGERIDQKNSYDSFKWYNGRILDAGLQWFDQEPNNDGGNEDCLTFTFFFTKNVRFALNDDRCSKDHYFICEEKCPDLSYQYFPALDLCFKVYDEHATWSEARDRCRQDKTDLLEPDTAQKLAFFGLYLNATNNGDVEKFWVGARDENRDRTYEWLTSSKVVPSEFWHSTEPSVLSANEHCAALHFFSQDHHLLLNDLNCDSNKIRFICEDIW